jgi:DNA-binding XRE family transcriptional regulator
MRTKIQKPRIIKINWIRALSASVVFNNGESRIIDFKKVLQETGNDINTPAAILLIPEELAKAELQNNTLSWHNVNQYITNRNSEMEKVPFEIGADVLYDLSEPEKNPHTSGIGRLIRDVRIKSGLTQQELAQKSGTTRNYISRIENDHSGIELDTLRKIIEIGLGKKLELIIR